MARRVVLLAVMEAEPLARLAAERLRDAGVECAVRPLGVGPGGWGMAANLPHALEVRQEDAERAREVLGLPLEGAPLEGGPPGGPPTGARWRALAMAALLVLALAAAVVAAEALFDPLLP